MLSASIWQNVTRDPEGRTPASGFTPDLNERRRLAGEPGAEQVLGGQVDTQHVWHAVVTDVSILA